jgi:tetratricopeptide (TPR) repeat protein
MFTEDHLMRIINQFIAVLMYAIGLRKAGKYSEARQVIEQAIQQITGLSADLIDQMDDEIVLSMLTTNGQLDIERLAVLGDLYLEKGGISFDLGQPDPGIFAYARALRFILEVVLANDSRLSPESMVKIETLVQKLDQKPLPIDTQLALSDYYRRLLDKDDQTLAAGGTSRKQIDQALARLQVQIDSFMNTTGH